MCADGTGGTITKTIVKTDEWLDVTKRITVRAAVLPLRVPRRRRRRTVRKSQQLLANRNGVVLQKTESLTEYYRRLSRDHFLPDPYQFVTQCGAVILLPRLLAVSVNK